MSSVQNLNYTSQGNKKIGSQTDPVKLIDDPGEVSAHLSKYSLYIMIVLLILLLACSVSLFFMWDFSNKFYKIVSSGQDSLCNFYTCSGPGDCDNYPKIILPDGKQVCAPG